MTLGANLVPGYTIKVVEPMADNITGELVPAWEAVTITGPAPRTLIVAQLVPGGCPPAVTGVWEMSW